MSFATDKWFKHLHEEIITEGLSDIGLDPEIEERIKALLPEASEKGRVWVGNSWKDYSPSQRSGERRFTRMLVNVLRGPNSERQSKFQKGEFNILADLLETYADKIKFWPKAKRRFLKNARKMKVSESVIEQTLLDLKQVEISTWNDFTRKIENLLLTLNQNPNNYDIIKSFPPSAFLAAEDECYKYQQTREDPEQIIYTFDDGSYWYDLDTYQCSMEGDRMGHCGRDERGSLYSLRKRDRGKKQSKSYVTISYSEAAKTIFQIKGRSNTCPPRELWSHIVKFIELSGATVLEEYGEYSNDEDEFQELGEFLSVQTGIDFAGSFSKKFADFSDLVNERFSLFEASPLAQRADIDGPDVQSDDYGEGTVIMWSDAINGIAAELPFDLTEKLFRAVAVYDPNPDVPDDVEDELFNIFKNEDRNDIFDGANYFPEVNLLKADSYEQAISKASSFTSLLRATENNSLLEGDKSYIVLWGDFDAFNEKMREDGMDFNDPSSYEDWLEEVESLVEDLDDSLDEMENYLISQKLIERSEIVVFKDKIDEEFNNFIVSTTSQGRGEYDIASTGLLFKTTAAEMETIVDLGLFNDFRRNTSGYLSNEVFKALVLGKLKEKEAQALEFAEKQMKLNFGDKYEKKIESLWSKIKSSKVMGANFYDQMYVGFKPQVPKKVANPRSTQVMNMESSFYYKIEVILNKQSVEFFGPFLEYYDNNFELVTGAFDFALKQMISRKARAFKKQSDSDTNLSLQEAPLDVRVYEIDFVMSYPLGQGFEITDIHNIIRAIPDVTTVRTVGETKRTQGNRTVSLQRLKFALRGQKNRTEWVKLVLLPQIRKISAAIRVHKFDRANLVSSSTQRLEETYYNSTMRQSPGRTTPVPTIQSLIDDWVEGGVMYDAPTNVNLTRYSVMMPVEDLMHLCGREPRKHGHHFDAGYEYFIQNGPRDPIYLAIGKNGRAKITGNEDDLRYAVKAGVEEVPVFISYQRQV